MNRTVSLLLLFCLLFPLLSFAEERDVNIQKSLEASVSLNWGRSLLLTQEQA